MEKYLFTSESVTEGHPDKVADAISDSVLDAIMAQDKNCRVACETLVTTGMAFISGEITTDCYVDMPQIVRDTIRDIGYCSSQMGFDCQTCSVITSIDRQSPDIAQGVNTGEGLYKEQGAGDQGMMFGYATNETENYMPLAVDLSHRILNELAAIRREGEVMTYLRPDSKSQVTMEYDHHNVPNRVNTIVVSTQHDEFDEEKKMLDRIYRDVVNILIPRVKAKLPEQTQKLFDDNIIYHVNPTGKFVIGGPHGDTGLTGRKIIVDTYGGKGAHGGGAFSGKDPSKVDRSGAYATRHIAKNLVAAGLCDEILVQVSYAIGVAEPTSISVDTFGTSRVNLNNGEIAKKVAEIFDMRPAAIESRLKLRQPMYSETAAYGHMGRTPETVTKTFERPGGESLTLDVELFTWEKLDYVDEIKSAFGL